MSDHVCAECGAEMNEPYRSAPDLLAALHEISKTAHTHNAVNARWLAQIADAAIAKARGEAVQA